ncbi:MAG: ATP-binding protein [Ferruginibacter sp.]
MKESFELYFFGFLLAFLLLGMFMLIMVVLFSRKQQKNKLEKLRMENQFQQSLIEAQVETQEQTLTTLSQEIHDNVGQVLSLAKLNLNTVQKDKFPLQDVEKISGSVELISKAIADLRALSRSLNGEMMVDIGLADAMQNEAKQLQNTGSFKVDFSSKGTAFELPRQKEVVLYRIVQECFHNILKHSGAQNVKAGIEFLSAAVSIFIKDDGKGFNEAELLPSKAGLGLRNMKSRAAFIGAAISIVSEPGKGTAIEILLPAKEVSKK